MKFRYRLTRLISRIENGVHQNSIIVWQKQATLVKCVSVEESNFTTSVPVQWEWFIRVNLWLIVFDFRFKTGEK